MTEQTKMEKLATRIGDAVRESILRTSDFVDDIAENLGIDKSEAPDEPLYEARQNNRLKKGLWTLLNDEFDFPGGEAFEPVWADFEELLSVHGMKTEVVKRHERIMDKLREEDEILERAAQIHRDRAKRAAEARAGMKAETDATVYKDGQRFGPMSEEQIEKSARWVLAQDRGETLTFEPTISKADQAKILARAQALSAVLDATPQYDIYADRPAEEQADTIEAEADRG